jgi:hypothetical protein
MASIIKIKRSEVSGNPAVLGAGELAYSALADNGSNGGDRLYIGMGVETAGNAVNHVIIGGKRYTDLIDGSTNTNVSNTIVRRDAFGNFTANQISAQLIGNASTATKWSTPRNLTLTGDVTGNLVGVDGSAAVSAAVTLATVNSNTGSFGNSVTVPSFTVNSKGLVTAASSAAIPTATNTVLGLSKFDSSFTVVAGLVSLTNIDGGSY